VDRPLLELNSNLTWNLAHRVDITAQYTSDQKAFYPIPRQTFTVPSNRILVGTVSDKARSSWWLGCRVSVNIDLGVFDSTSRFGMLGEVWRENVGLRQLRHIEWDDYGVSQYTIILYIPFWLEHFYAEAWWYDGTASSSYEELLKGIDARTIRIERNLSLINSGDTDSNTNSENDGTGGI
jgi:hypothetical protein